QGGSPRSAQSWIRPRQSRRQPVRSSAALMVVVVPYDQAAVLVQSSLQTVTPECKVRFATDYEATRVCFVSSKRWDQLLLLAIRPERRRRVHHYGRYTDHTAQVPAMVASSLRHQVLTRSQAQSA